MCHSHLQVMINWWSIPSHQMKISINTSRISLSLIQSLYKVKTRNWQKAIWQLIALSKKVEQTSMLRLHFLIQGIKPMLNHKNSRSLVHWSRNKLFWCLLMELSNQKGSLWLVAVHDLTVRLEAKTVRGLQKFKYRTKSTQWYSKSTVESLIKELKISPHRSILARILVR